MKKYYYEIEFMSRALSPCGRETYSAISVGLLKDIKDSFKEYCQKHGFNTTGGTLHGKLLNAKGQLVGNFNFGSKTY